MSKNSPIDFTREDSQSKREADTEKKVNSEPPSKKVKTTIKKKVRLGVVNWNNFLYFAYLPAGLIATLFCYYLALYVCYRYVLYVCVIYVCYIRVL
jgi:hypothetical protein